MVASDVEMEQPATSAPTLRGGLTPDASRLFRVYKTVSAMLNKRGYMVPREMREMTPPGFTQKFGEHPSRESLTILVVSFICISWRDLEHVCYLLLTNGISVLCSLFSVHLRRKRQMMKLINYSCSSTKMKRLESNLSKSTPIE